MALRWLAALVCAGLVVGVAWPGHLTALFGQATLYVFLPALIFEGAWHLNLHEMQRWWQPIAILALPGVLVTAAVVAVAVHLSGFLPWNSALLLGALLGATDPVAVIAIFRQLAIPSELATIIESESLLNDGIAVVLYQGVLGGLMLSGGTAALSRVALGALLAVIAGVLLGMGLAQIVARALRPNVGAAAQSMATFLGAYAAYFGAQSLHLSGIFAVIAFGVALREIERLHIDVSTVNDVEGFWARGAAISNGILFFLVGASLSLSDAERSFVIMLLTIFAVFAARALLAHGVLGFAAIRLPPGWRSVIRMSGIRGALCLALAIAVPQHLPGRSLVIDATFAVVVVSLLTGTLTLERRISALQLHEGGDAQEATALP